MSSEPFKILLHNAGEDPETVWAIAVPSPPGRIFARLDNVPFLHAKPTYGDVVEVAKQDDQPGFLSWNRSECSFEDIPQRLVEDGGRYAVIVEYECDDAGRFKELVAWTDTLSDLEWEGLRSPTSARPGTAYVAVKYECSTAEVMALLRRNPFGFRFELMHPL